jgi:branched-chain amino acid transport system substrate-binding protein
MMRAPRRRAMQSLAVLFLAGALAACGADEGEGGGAKPDEGVYEDRIDFGVIADQTGPTAVTQLPYLHGIETQIKKVNAAGGINGREVSLLIEDEKYDVQTGLTAYKKLVSQTPVVGINGLNNSSLQVAALPNLERDKVPIVGAYSTTKQALSPFNKYFLSTECSYADQADVAVPYMIEKTGVQQPSVAVFSLDVESGFEWAGLVEARVNDAGGEYLGHTPIAPTATEADAQVQKIASQNPDFIALHGSPNTALILLKGLEKFDVDVPVIGIFATGAPTVYNGVSEQVGSQFETVNCYTPPDVEEPGMAELKEDAAKYGYEKDVTTTDYVAGYVNGMVIVEALEKAGDDLSRESLIEAAEQIENFDTGGLSEPITFTSDNHAGVQAVRPYRFNYDTKKVEAVGEYSDYEQYLKHEYLGGGT